jgi:hypothetical protein
MSFKSELLYKSSNIGKYELHLDGSTGWGILFPNGYIEVEEGPHDCVGFMRGEVNGISVYSEGYNVPRIPGSYWMGDMSDGELLKFFDEVVLKYSQVSKW